MKHKLSPWHSADTKPKHVGVYQVKTKGFENATEYAYWYGNLWSPQTKQIELVEKFVDYDSVSIRQNKQWRGILK